MCSGSCKMQFYASMSIALNKSDYSKESYIVKYVVSLSSKTYVFEDKMTKY